MYEFPSRLLRDEQKTQVKDPNKKIVVTYSSINGNGFGGYGEMVMGTKGTLISRKKGSDALQRCRHETNVGVVKGKDGGRRSTRPKAAARPRPSAKLALEPVPPAAATPKRSSTGPGASAIRSPENQPQCQPKVALGDAVIALTTNIAIATGRKSRIEFKHEWFDIDSDETPEGIKPDISRYT